MGLARGWYPCPRRRSLSTDARGFSQRGVAASRWRADSARPNRCKEGRLCGFWSARRLTGS